MASLHYGRAGGAAGPSLSGSLCHMSDTHTDARSCEPADAPGHKKGQFVYGEQNISKQSWGMVSLLDYLVLFEKSGVYRYLLSPLNTLHHGVTTRCRVESKNGRQYDNAVPEVNREKETLLLCLQ